MKSEVLDSGIRNSRQKEKTCDRILSAACRLFSQKGYHQVTVQSICELADVNIAAVNYHYGSKEKLYTAVWRDAYRRTQDTYFSFMSKPEVMPPEERLRAFVKAKMLSNLTSDINCCFPNIMHREMMEPTFALKDIKREVIAPRFKWMQNIFSELLGDAASAEKISLFTFSVISQCVFVSIHKQVSAMATDKEEPLILPPEIETVTSHIVEMILCYVRKVGGVCEG